MAVVSYSAQRELTAGTSVNDTVVLDLILMELDEGRSVVRSEHVSLAGNREAIYWRNEATWACIHKPVLLGGTDELALRMFLASVEGLETFQFAPYNTSSDSPIDYRNAVITSNGWKLVRAVRRGNGGSSDYMQVNFALVEVP